MIKAILLDSWGTIVENGIYPSPVKQVRYMLRIREPFPEYIEKFENTFMTEQYDDLKEAFRQVAKAFNVNPPEFVYDKLVGMWNKNMLLAKPYPETIEVLQELNKKYKLGLVSNTDKFSLDPVLEKFDLRKLFTDLFLSYETGLLKTDPKLFKLAMKKLKVKPAETVMVGDSMESDIKGAEKAGIQAILVDRRGKREYEKKVADLSQLKDYIK